MSYYTYHEIFLWGSRNQVLQSTPTDGEVQETDGHAQSSRGEKQRRVLDAVILFDEHFNHRDEQWVQVTGVVTEKHDRPLPKELLEVEGEELAMEVRRVRLRVEDE